MTKPIDRELQHRTFGGIIFLSDFCTNHSRNKNKPSWGSRIASDKKFDWGCKQAAENKNIPTAHFREFYFH